MNPDSTQPRSEICWFSWMNKSYTARLKFRFGSFNWSWSWSRFRFSWLIEIASLSPILAFLDLHQHSFVFSTTEFLEPSPKKSNHCSCLWTCFYWPELKKRPTNTTSRTGSSSRTHESYPKPTPGEWNPKPWQQVCQGSSLHFELQMLTFKSWPLEWRSPGPGAAANFPGEKWWDRFLGIGRSQPEDGIDGRCRWVTYTLGFQTTIKTIDVNISTIAEP